MSNEHKYCIGKNDHSWEVGYDKGYLQGRADGIKECIEIIVNIMPGEPFIKNSKHYENWKMNTTELRMVRDIMLEQLKENRNE